MKIKGITKQDNGCYAIIYDDCVIMSKTDVTSPTDRLTDEEQLRADLCEYVVKLKAELKRWKDVSPDRTNLEYVISLENSNKELDTQVENMKCESELLENILNYVCSVPTRQRCAIWDDINKVCSDLAIRKTYSGGKEMSEEKIVPQNLIDIWNEYVGACEARDYAVKGFFKFQVRNAVWLGRIAEEKRTEFWSKIREIYPELSDKAIKYNREKKVVFEIPER